MNIINYDDDIDINWNAVMRCARCWYNENTKEFSDGYTEYMLETWGIDHGGHYIRVIDNEKYMMFLLKWS